MSVKIYIAESSEESVSKLYDYFFDFEMIILGDSGLRENILKDVDILRPDIIVIGENLTDTNAFQLVKEIALTKEKVPCFVFMKEYEPALDFEGIIDSGWICYISNKDSLLAVESKINDILDNRYKDVDRTPVEAPLVFEAITKCYLDGFCVPRHISGYKYLVEIIRMINNNPVLKQESLQNIYYLTSNHFHTVQGRVERAVRHAIDISWDFHNKTDCSSVFSEPYKKFKSMPKPKQFILCLAENQQKMFDKYLESQKNVLMSESILDTEIDSDDTEE